MMDANANANIYIVKNETLQSKRNYDRICDCDGLPPGWKMGGRYFDVMAHAIYKLKRGIPYQATIECEVFAPDGARMIIPAGMIITLITKHEGGRWPTIRVEVPAGCRVSNGHVVRSHELRGGRRLDLFYDHKRGGYLHESDDGWLTTKWVTRKEVSDLLKDAID